MEIKAAGSMPLWLAELLAQGGIKQTSFSKYGMAYMTMLRPVSYTHLDVYKRQCARYGS